ncbi:D-2-hydroxyacid dehydrogenase family protein [Pseudochelatococcus sp. B33]
MLDDYQKIALSIADWSPITAEVEVVAFHDFLPTREARIATLRDFDIVVCMRERTRLDAEVIAALPKLRLIVTTGRYNAAIDMDACAARDITVCSTGDVHGAAAELTWALILALARHIPAEVRDFKAGGTWQPRLGHSLASRRLGVLGFGRLGVRVARVAAAFGMPITVWSKNITEERARAEGATAAASLDDLLRTSDIVSVHLRLNEETRGIIGARELGLMKPTAFLVNTSRGPLVDENALIDALDGNRLAGAALDVFHVEPLPADSPLRRVARLIGTPHVGFVTEETFAVFYRDVVEDIAAWLKGAPVRIVSALS